jgi:uncharacterized membrane protein YhaH (DUF805 family)
MGNITIFANRQITYGFSSIVLFLTIFALVFELLPEMSAKMIVVPTLIITIGYIIFNILKQKRMTHKGERGN